MAPQSATRGNERSLIDQGSYFAGSQPQGNYWYDYGSDWLPQFFLSIFLEPSSHWLDAGMYSEYPAALVKDGRARNFGTSWLEEAIRQKCIVPRLRDECSSLRDVRDELEKGGFSGLASAEDRRQLGRYYSDMEDADEMQTVPWNDVDRDVRFGIALEKRLTSVFSASPPTDIEHTGALVEFLNFVRAEGQDAFVRSLKRTREREYSGFRVSDFAYAAYETFLQQKPDTDIVDLRTVAAGLEKRRSSPHAKRLLRMVTDEYDRNFAANTTRSLHTLVRDEISYVLASRPGSRPERDSQRVCITEIRWPRVDDLLSCNPLELRQIRQFAEDQYFPALQAWKLKPNEDTTNRVGGALRSYAENVCKTVTHQKSRHTLSLTSKAVGLV